MPDLPRFFARITPEGALVGLLDYGAPPWMTPDGTIALTEAQHASWRADMTQRWDAPTGDLVPGGVRPSSVPVPKAVVVARLIAAGQLRAVRAELGFGRTDDELSDDALALRERYDAATVIVSDDHDLREVLRRAGADPDAVLAS